MSCTFCGPGTWTIWEVVTDDGVSLACDWHHAEMSQAKIIQLERMRVWKLGRKFARIKARFTRRKTKTVWTILKTQSTMSKENYIPEFAKKGVLINPANPQPLIRQNAEKNHEWEFQPVADKWYPMAEEIKQTLFDGVFTLEKTSPLPSPPIAIEDMRNYQTLASYRIVPDGYGINDKLTLNAQHFIKNEGVWLWDWGGDWGLAETITHGLAHEKHKHWGDTPPDHGKYFRNLLLELGIYCTPNGSHYRPAEEGKPFAILMHRLGIQRPENEIILPDKSKISYWEPKDERKKRGRSTVHVKCLTGTRTSWRSSLLVAVTFPVFRQLLEPFERRQIGAASGTVFSHRST